MNSSEIHISPRKITAHSREEPMEKTIRHYPPVRRRRGERSSDELTMLSARIEEELNEYVRTTAYETRKSKQDIVAEALRLHRECRQAMPAAE